jgi:sugar O-acyltransferase (sialic acid O-acetyltransferase NeuD family)
MTDLVIFGSGGFARQVHQIVEDINADRPAWNVLGFLNDDPSTHGRALHDLPVLGGRDWMQDQTDVCCIVAIGNPLLRKTVVDYLELPDDHFASAVHPRAWIGNRVDLGAGSVVAAGVSLETDLTIGRFAAINIGATITHEACIGDFVTIGPNTTLAGGVQLGDGVEIGAGATVIPRIVIGDWAHIGAGATVIRSVDPYVVAVGVPARPIRQTEEPD